MYRNAAGDRKFSFSRFINNAVPNLALAPQRYDFEPAEQDALFEYQLGEPDPLKLCDMAFLCGHITQNKSTSKDIYKALVKNGVLDANETSVRTANIGKNFTHQLRMITAHAQKKLINLLFFWEEEIQRWKVLIGEQDELRIVIEAERSIGGNVGNYEKRLKEIEGLLRLKPTMRGKEARDADTLPEYQAPSASKS
ncbi:hypothetical protein EJ04DRAFT_65979 [Polyplosphaeria fusca]|uniref:Uncharacterized protein n=1 Tax=Polyplosphaeria fusca TaxID=682080 RepID=A0A9P4QLH7_9PLEO|nr:hypothetical protein EJ04DRAFT_65979 [Polyplosphaeria fusca]